MSHSSDTDDNEYDKLKEAVIEIKDLVTTATTGTSSGNKKNNNNKAVKKGKKSLRTEKVEEEHELHTTPEFRSHVAKKLSQLIDSSIELGCQWVDPNNQSGSEADSDIKLFSASSVSAAHGNSSEKKLEQPKRRHKSITSSSSSSSEDERIIQAAVSPEFVLSSSCLHLNQPESQREKECSNADLSCNTNPGSQDILNSPEVLNTGDIVVNKLTKQLHEHDNISRKRKKKKKKRKKVDDNK